MEAISITWKPSLALVHLGQLPNQQMSRSVLEHVPPHVMVTEVGVLDGLERSQIERQYAPSSSSPGFWTTLRDGQPVLADRSFVHMRLQETVTLLGSAPSVIGVLCSGELPPLRAKTRVLVPSALLEGFAKSLRHPGPTLIVMPTETSLNSTLAEFARWGVPATGMVVPAGPLCGASCRSVVPADTGPQEELAAVILNCFGYPPELGRALAERYRCPVVGVAALYASCLGELFRYF